MVDGDGHHGQLAFHFGRTQDQVDILVVVADRMIQEVQSGQLVQIGNGVDVADGRMEE